jgi:hypothetical protein
MEFVEGEDLSQRTARGPIPIDDALSIAKQIAEALEDVCSHEPSEGIVFDPVAQKNRAVIHRLHAGLNPATPAASTDVSTTPLRRGRFRGFGDNRELRLVPSRPDLSDRVQNLLLRDALQVG